MLLRPRKEARGLLTRFFRGNSTAGSKGHAWLRLFERGLIRKAIIGVLILAGFAIADGLFGTKLTDQLSNQKRTYGFLFLNFQLPPAASLERTDQVAHKIETILKETDGVDSYTTIDGFSLLNRISVTYNGFFFVAFAADGTNANTRRRKF